MESQESHIDLNLEGGMVGGAAEMPSNISASSDVDMVRLLMIEAADKKIFHRSE